MLSFLNHSAVTLALSELTLVTFICLPISQSRTLFPVRESEMYIWLSCGIAVFYWTVSRLVPTEECNGTTFVVTRGVRMCVRCNQKSFHLPIVFVSQYEEP